MSQQPVEAKSKFGIHIHSAANLDPTVEVAFFTIIGEDVSIGPQCRIGPHCNLGNWPTYGKPTPRNSIRIGRAVEIGARVSISGDVEIGENVRIGNNVTLVGPLKISERAEIFDSAIIGAPGQYPGRNSTSGRILIESDVTIREFVVINQPVDRTTTRIGRNSYIMARSQIDHDCDLGEHVKLATGVTLGGAVKIDEHAYLGMNCVVHQGIHVGAHTMLGMNCAILKNVPPFAVIVGKHFSKVNAVGLSRRGFTPFDIAEIEAFFATNLVDKVPSTQSPNIRLIADFYNRHVGGPVFILQN